MTLRIGIDIGGTFTDLVAIHENGTIRTHKTPSTPADYSIGIETGLKALLKDKEPITEVLHATTIGSNTILEARGAKTALITTKGFRDVLEIRDIRMPRLYDMHWTKPKALVERRLRLEVTEKTRPDGSIAIPLDDATVQQAIDFLKAEEIESLAICLLNSYANPAHEAQIEQAVRTALPHLAITASHRLLPEIKEYPRTSTTVVNAYLQPIVRAYLTSLQARLKTLGIPAGLHLMQSNGGLATSAHASAYPAHIVESGPAAGVVGGAVLARRLELPGVVTFDMGGTTAKAGLVENGEVLRAEAMEVGAGVMAGARLLVGAGYMLKLPAIDLAEVGAGGGSICRLDEAGAPKAGPRSAGADPGPVCYGRGNTEPTITDCNLALGYLDPAGLAGGTIALDIEAARAAIAAKLAKPLNLTVEQAAHGMLRIASATMMRAIRAVSVERGRDVRGFTLLAFGGNGPLFAATIAAELGMHQVLIPPMPGLFSAFGLLMADTEHHATASLRLRLANANPATIQTAINTMLAAGTANLTADGFPANRQALRLAASARYVGQSSELSVPLRSHSAADLIETLPEAFGVEHERTYGFRAPQGEPVELMAISLVAAGLPERPRLPETIPPADIATPTTRRAWFPSIGWTETPVTSRAGLSTAITGPAIIQEYDATCLVPPGATASLDAFGNVRIGI